jgi:hypothetical protein
MSKEATPLQHTLFTSELVDNRSSAQKRRDREADAGQQVQMFRTPEMVQLEGRKPNLYREWVNQAQVVPLILESSDVPDDDEQEQERQREAEALTVPMFGEPSPTPSLPISPNHVPSEGMISPSLPKSGVIFDADPIIQRGLRAKLRRQSLAKIVQSPTAS